MDILDYETVLAVARHGSWAAAGYATFQSPSSVSKRVSKLEKALGVRIFDRSSRPSGARLTETGAIVLPYIRQITERYNDLASRAEELRGELAARLRAGYPSLAGTVGETEILARFRVQFPECTIVHVLRSGPELLRLMAAGALDCAFLLSSEPLSAIKAALGESKTAVLPYMKHETLFIGLPLSHPLARRGSIRAEELKNETVLINSADPGGFLSSVFPGLDKRPVDFISPRVVTECVLSGAGVLPIVSPPAAYLSEAVRFVPVSDIKPRARAYFLYPAENAPRAVRAVLRLVKDYSERMSGSGY